MDILHNKFFVLGLLALIGMVAGFTLLRTLFLLLERKALKKDLIHLARFFRVVANVSVFVGGALALHFHPFFPLDIPVGTILKKAIAAFNIIIFTYLAGEFCIYLYDRYNIWRENKTTSLFHIIIRLLVYSSGIIILANAIGIELTPILTALGVGGLAVALALQDTLSNLFSGIHILAAKQLKPGDYIQLDSGEEGYVVDINWRNTVLKNLLENVIIIPNNKLSGSIITNYYTIQPHHFFHVIVGVHYDSDLEHVERVTLDEARKLQQQMETFPDDFEPRVRFFEFADSSINLKVWLASDCYENHMAIKHTFIKNLHKRYEEEGIVIPFPIRTVYMKND